VPPRWRAGPVAARPGRRPVPDQASREGRDSALAARVADIDVLPPSPRGEPGRT
jgi:hypothetical protein